MKIRLLWHIVRRQFVTQRLVIIPFILAVSVLFMIEYTLVSIGLNRYVQQENDLFVPFIIIANIFMALLTLIFILYANHFMMSQRRKEFSIFMTLGMTKKGMRFMIVMETIIQFIIISVISIAGGYLLGAVFFLFIQKIMGSPSATLKHYPFDASAMLITLIIIAVVMCMLLIFNLFSVNFQKPITYQHRSDSSSGISRWLRYFLIIIGIAALYLGYFIALQEDTTFGAFFKIWIVIGLVIVGTYAFFIGMSEIIISLLQHLPNIYYHPRYFFVVTGMRVRLKMNAISLATITLLCTFLIVTLTMSVTTYRDMDHAITKLFKNDYDITYTGQSKESSERRKTIENIQRDLRQVADARDFKVYQMVLFRATLEKKNAHYNLKQANDDMPIDFIGNEGAIFSRQSVMITVLTEEDYNRYQKSKVNLDKESLGMITNVPIFKRQSKVGLNNQWYKVKQLNAHKFNLMMIQDSMILIVKDKKQLSKVKEYYAPEQKKLTTSINFNTPSDKRLTTDQAKMISKKYSVSINSKSEMLGVWHRLTGGIIFVGGVVSFVLTIGIFLMMYYKQISEGYANQHNYGIMEKVGLDNKKIEKIIRTQMFWLFSIPIVVALLHTLVARKIIYTILNMIGINNYHVFVTSYIIIVLITLIIYIIMYKITSNVYSKVIHQQRK
ncbi:ABC transporter permease [Staphylococcus sp. 30400_3112M30941]|nr:ABC transporter permease [Staphylococcus sp. 30403_3112M30944]MBO0944859.1 ABC transporter permease [Staphylococcus sp. 30402_3112M30943]MBO0964181.1 ABC transporter permease [Staphylococcus sp. 30400_3112M30941]MBO0966009.1 ABC transporter permease [Staphylococcus sp. 30401_3112M30942]